ncbi:MAG: class I SAM-dependent methyltransferase [Polyangiaceae bacterium]
MSDARGEQRAFLNRYYGISRYFYDATRKYYLFGRDEALREIAADRRWKRLIEIGPGTGRNLARLRRLRPDAELGGVEASDAMLEHARKRCPYARLEQGFAEDAPLASLLSGAPDRILFSYCLSMVEGQQKALAHTRAALAPAGEVVVVDFADLDGLPDGLSRVFRAYLGAFHVHPLDDAAVAEATSVRFGPRRYYVVARFGPSA